MSSVALKNVTKAFGGTVVVDNVSLEVESGEFVVFLGPSGCGKSTMLRMLAGLETPDSGELHIGERRVDLLPPGKRGVSMVFQNYALYPHMSVYENLAFGLRNAGLDEGAIRERAEDAARRLEIGALMQRRPDQLSGGQRQRVAIARAIVKKPALFLFDEPLSNLDAALRTRTRVELARLHQSLGATMIFVTHDQIEAMTMADRIVILNEARIEQIGTPMDIYHRPATRFVACFVGSPSMNLLPCTIAPDAHGFARACLPNGVQASTRIPVSALPQQDRFELGLRPEFMRFTTDTPDLKGEALVIERLGERTLLHVDLGEGLNVIAEDAGMSSVRVGNRVGLRLRADAAHLFDEAGLAYHAEPA